MGGLREGWKDANGGQTELACKGSCPGLMLSVCEGCKGRLDPSLHTQC